MAKPLGQRGFVRPLVVGDCNALLKLGNVALDSPAQTLDPGLSFGALLFLRSRKPPGAVLGLVEIIRQEFGQLTAWLVLHRIDVVLEEIAVTLHRPSVS